MLIDFEVLHSQLLVGRRGEGGWFFTPAHNKRPGADLYVASHQCFSNNGLNISLIIRNTMDEQQRATSADPLVALAFSHKIDGKYLLAKDPNRVVVPLYLNEVIQLFAMLSGAVPTATIEVHRPSVAPKVLKGWAARNDLSRYVLKAYTVDEDGTHHSVDVALAPDHVFKLQAFLLAYGCLCHPWMTQESIRSFYLSSAIGMKESSQQEVQQSQLESPPASRSDDKPPRSVSQPATREHVTRAVFAVGVNKWPKARRDVIRHIQETASIEAMDRLIRAGNLGDFSEWDRISALMQD